MYIYIKEGKLGEKGKKVGRITKERWREGGRGRGKEGRMEVIRVRWMNR